MATCAVSGTIKDASETAVSSCTIKANIVTPFVVGTAFIVPKELSTTSDASGNWSLSLSQSQSYLISIEYPINSTDGKKRLTFSVTTPASSTANFSSLATELI